MFFGFFGSFVFIGHALTVCFLVLVGWVEFVWEPAISAKKGIAEVVDVDEAWADEVCVDEVCDDEDFRPSLSPGANFGSFLSSGRLPATSIGGVL